MLRLRLICAIAAVLILAACDDPSSAGLDLIGEEGGVPVDTIVVATSVAQDTLSEITGGLAAISLATTTRVLAGTAEDPLFGTVTADTFLDFVRPASLPEGFTEGTVTRAVLELPVEYVYGDPMSRVLYDLYQIPANWTSTEAGPSDSFVDFAAAMPFGTVEVSRRDSIAELLLPDAWVAGRGDTLVGVGFEERFHGIALRAAGNADGYTGPGAVRGFDAQRIRLALTVADSTVRYAANEVATRIDWEDLPTPPADRVVARDGAEEALVFDFDFEGGVLGQPLNNAEFRVALDTLLLQTPVAGVPFERPRPVSLELLADVDNEDNPVQRLGTLVFDPNVGAYRLSSAALTAIMQEELLGTNAIEGFRLRVLNDPGTVSVVPVFSPTLPDLAPRFEFVVSGGR